MTERIKHFNKIVASTSTLLALAAFNACSASSETTQLAPECSVNIGYGDTLKGIVEDSHAYPHVQDGIDEIEYLNSGIIENKLGLDDEVALPGKMCIGLIDNPRDTYRLRMLDDASSTQE